MNDCNRDVHEPCSRFQAARAVGNVDIDELKRPARESIGTVQGQPIGSHPAPNSVSAD